MRFFSLNGSYCIALTILLVMMRDDKRPDEVETFRLAFSLKGNTLGLPQA